MRKGQVLMTLALLCLLAGGCGGDGFGDPSVRTPLPVRLVGEWRDSQQPMSGRVLGIYDVGSGRWMSNDESDKRAGSGFLFYKDGRYVRASYITSSNGGCVIRAWTYQQGSVSLDGRTLTLYPAVHRQKYEDGCNSSANMEWEGSHEPQAYAAGFQSDISSGFTYLYLQTSDSTLKLLGFVNISSSQRPPSSRSCSSASQAAVL